MENKVKCNVCHSGTIAVNKICKLRWKVTCSNPNCTNTQVLYYPQLYAYLETISKIKKE